MALIDLIHKKMIWRRGLFGALILMFLMSVVYLSVGEVFISPLVNGALLNSN